MKVLLVNIFDRHIIKLSFNLIKAICEFHFPTKFIKTPPVIVLQRKSGMYIPVEAINDITKTQTVSGGAIIQN